MLVADAILYAHIRSPTSVKCVTYIIEKIFYYKCNINVQRML